jgi:hypothetical protein
MTAAAVKKGILNGFTTPLVLISFLEAVLDVNVLTSCQANISSIWVLKMLSEPYPVP